jgi:hypothetical protein
MPTRHSEYARQANDAYWTPQWCFDALHSVERLNIVKRDPAPREPHNYNFFATDGWVGDIATNPPFNRAEEFIRHGLRLTEPYGGKVCLLLPFAYDTAKGRADLFRAAPFKCKLSNPLDQSAAKEERPIEQPLLALLGLGLRRTAGNALVVTKISPFSPTPSRACGSGCAHLLGQKPITPACQILG